MCSYVRKRLHAHGDRGIANRGYSCNDRQDFSKAKARCERHAGTDRGLAYMCARARSLIALDGGFDLDVRIYGK